MRIFKIDFNTSFEGKRKDRNIVSQLKQNNSYDLNLINQKRISKAIDNLAQVPGEENINFLLDVDKNLKYGTNIDLGKGSFNDWHVKLSNAAKNSLEKSSLDVRNKMREKVNNASNKTQLLTDEEKEILSLRENILSQVDKKELSNIKNKNIKELNRNLDYFIISSEVPLAKKLYIMKRLNYFMSPEYKINPELKDKKTQALAEIVNDIVVDTPESIIPNIKAVNQKFHGMCAAISIARKALAYEDKANYVDIIMSELDDSPNLQIYDITKLGTGTKIPLEKTYIDFPYALEKGYRIIDASALYWMQVANTAGSTNEFVMNYIAFDKESFDTFHDAHLSANLPDAYEAEQDYYRAAMKAKNILKGIKKSTILDKVTNIEKRYNVNDNIDSANKYNTLLRDKILEIAPNISNDKLRDIIAEAKTLKVKDTKDLNKIKNYKKDFAYLPNESKSAKTEKIKAFLAIGLGSNINSKVLNSNADDIFELLESIEKFRGLKKTSYVSKDFSRARSLYEAAAAVRTQQLQKLRVPFELNEVMIKYDIPDDETRVKKSLSDLILKLEAGELSPEIKASLIRNFAAKPDGSDLLEVLKNNQETIEYITTKSLDDLYNCSLDTDRKTALKTEIITLKSLILDQNNKKALIHTASKLKVQPNKKTVLNQLDKFIDILSDENCTEEEYTHIFNKMGKKSQMIEFKKNIEVLGNMLFTDESYNEQIARDFKIKNGLPENATMEQVANEYNRMIDVFNNISAIVSGYQYSLELTDENGKILNTINPIRLSVKKLEKDGQMISAKNLSILQEKINKVDSAIYSADYGEKMLLSELPKELVTFNSNEKQLLKFIESKINGWYANASRDLSVQYGFLKEQLEELNRQTGVKTGEDWVYKEGESGLSSRQQVKIIEHMTDRPYYVEDDAKRAIEKIKNSPYSGISATSVSGEYPAMHAQYISDIKPIEIKENGKTVQKEALFHDNSWGPSEHENRWIDENGLIRTDYSKNYGGIESYITNASYQNGTLIENLIDKTTQISPNNVDSKLYKKLGGGSGDYRYPLLPDAIIPGVAPNAQSMVRRIRWNTLVNPVQHFSMLEDCAKSMTKAEIQTILNKTNTIASGLYKDYQDIDSQINGDGIINKGIKTQEDYDKLSENHPIKLIMEKAALLNSFDDIPDMKILYKEHSMKDLEKLRKELKEVAKSNLEYAFGKKPDIAKYGTEAIRYKAYALIEQFAKDNNIKLKRSHIEIVNSMKTINVHDFDGRLDKTIDMMVSNFSDAISKNTPKFEDKTEKINDLANIIRKALRIEMGFTLADLNSSSSNDEYMKNIEEWIDDIYDPSSDEEFVQIFNRIQNMTTKEFRKEFDSKITEKVLGIKPVTGFDMLTKFRANNERIQNTVLNLMYYQRMGYSMSLSKTKPIFEYGKIQKKLRSAEYVGKRTFDDIYLDYHYDLFLLNIHKQYNKIKKQVFDKYGIFPAYPKPDFTSDEEIQNTLDKIFNEIDSGIGDIEEFKHQIKVKNQIQKLCKSINKLSDDKPLTSRQYNLMLDTMDEILDRHGEDSSIPDMLEAVYSLLELDPEDKSGMFKPHLNYLDREFTLYSKNLSGKSLEELVDSSLKAVSESRRDMILNCIAPRYQKSMFKLLNKYIKAVIKNLPVANEYRHEFEEKFKEYRVVNNPLVMLDKYMLMLAKDANTNNGRDLTQLELIDKEKVKNTYKSALKSLIIYSNILDMQYILMDCAHDANLNVVREEFKNSKLELLNGSYVTLDSDYAINQMLNVLTAGDDVETAVMFLDQLGLGEGIVEMASKIFSVDDAKAKVDRIHSILESVQIQTKFFKQELAKLSKEIDNDPNYEQKLNELEAKFKAKINKTNYRKTRKLAEKLFDEIRAQLLSSPEFPRHLILDFYREQMRAASMYLVNEDVELLNEDLKRLQNTTNLIDKIKLPVNSPMIAVRDKLMQSVNEIVDYTNSKNKRYPDLDVNTMGKTID